MLGLKPQARLALYQAWRIVSVALPVLGVALPGGTSAWDQIILAVLGLSGLGAATVAIKHVPTRQPDIGHTPRHLREGE